MRIGTDSSTESETAGSTSTSPARTMWQRMSSPRAAVWLFALALVAGSLYHVWVGGMLWFAGDIWTLLGRFTQVDPVGPFAPHNGHLIAIPWLIFRALFEVFGISSYLPYLVVGVATHASVAVLVRMVVRRCGVSPWLATLFAAALIAFGPGSENIFLPFQITLTGALALGMAQLLIADHEEPTVRRDLIAVAVGLLGLMCSGLFLAMIPLVGVAILLSRGWRAAAMQTVPPIAFYVLWRGIEGVQETSTPPPSLGVWAGWYTEAGFAGLSALAVGAPLAVLLGAASVYGYAASWWGVPLRESARNDAIPLGFLAGYATFVTTTLLSRSFLGLEAVVAPRYLYVYLVLAIPIVAPGIDRLVRRYPFAYVVLGIPLFAILWNATLGSDRPQSYLGPQPADTVALLEAPELASAAPDLMPDNSFFGHPGVTVTWLREVAASGRYPSDLPPSPRAALAPMMLSLSLSSGIVPGSGCQTITSERTITVEPGGYFSFQPAPGESSLILPVRPAGTPVRPAANYPANLSGGTLTNVSETPLELAIGSSTPLDWQLCRP